MAQYLKIFTAPTIDVWSASWKTRAPKLVVAFEVLATVLFCLNVVLLTVGIIIPPYHRFVLFSLIWVFLLEIVINFTLCLASRLVNRAGILLIAAAELYIYCWFFTQSSEGPSPTWNTMDNYNYVVALFSMGSSLIVAFARLAVAVVISFWAIFAKKDGVAKTASHNAVEKKE
jgi:hypothetical protein